MTKSNIIILQEDSFLLDSSLGKIAEDMETIGAAVYEFVQLTHEMSETDINQVKYKYLDWQRKCKILSQLLYRATGDLDAESKGAHEIHEGMFRKIQELATEKKPSFPAKENEGVK